MNQDHLWELLNVVPSRFLNTNVEGNLLNVVEDDRVPLRFVPYRPEKWLSPFDDPRIPLRFLKESEGETLPEVKQKQII